MHVSRTQANIVAVLTTVAFHPDGHLLCAGTGDGAIKLFDVNAGQLMHTFEPPQGAATAVQALTFSENGTWLASANVDQTAVWVWDLRKTSLLKTLEVGTPVTGVAWDYTGLFLAACGPGGLVVNQYSKSSKAWTEVLRKAVQAVDVKWGAKANALVALTSDGDVNVLGA